MGCKHSALKELAVPRASHTSEIDVLGSRRLHCTFAATPVLFLLAVVTVAKNKQFLYNSLNGCVACLCAERDLRVAWAGARFAHWFHFIKSSVCDASRQPAHPLPVFVLAMLCCDIEVRVLQFYVSFVVLPAVASFQLIATSARFA